MAKRGVKDLVRRAVISLSAVFALSASALPSDSSAVAPPEPPVEQPPAVKLASPAGLWKSEFFDAVIQLDACGPQNDKTCASFYWLNPQDQNIFDYFGDTRGGNSNNGFPFGPASTAPADIASLCGYGPRLDFHSAGAREWQGTLQLRGKGVTVNADVTQNDDNTLSLILSKAFIRQTDTWHRVSRGDPRYPPCQKPAAP